ncbi:hypothetical protein FRC00_009931 [Tulasnella sp. 408]|nr:hypothetical protein FRC00_009931 [Tulasnella sp. 408]
MPRNKELTVDVATRISDILEEYPAGPAILREILQNTDDAGGRVQDENDRDNYASHFDAFNGILDSQDDILDGTAIRLPLRLPDTTSRIKPTPMSIEAARELFDIFINDDLPVVMLFLKHITAIEVSEISPSGKKTLRAVARVENATEIVAERCKTRGRSPNSATSHYKLVITETRASGAKSESKRKSWAITHYVESFQDAASAMATRLNRASDLDGVEASMASDKLFPHVALALPLPDNDTSQKQSFSGRLFTLLPLPIFTHFPLHIHATLALTPSRQNLRNAQETVTDPKLRLRIEWNRVIFARLVPRAWVSLMSYLISTPQGIDVFDTWPSSKDIRDGGQGYWPAFPHVLLMEAAAQDVWTLRSEPSSHKRLEDVLVTTNLQDPTVLSTLELCSLPVVVVSPNVLDIISQSEFKNKVLEPATAIPFLLRNSELLSRLGSTATKVLCDFIVSANDFDLLSKLPIMPRVAGGRTSILPHAEYILANPAEARVLGPRTPEMLSAAAMSDGTIDLLVQGSNGRVRFLQHGDVVTYLQRVLGELEGAGVSDIVNPADTSVIKSLVEFWAWMDTWEKEKLDALVADKANWNTIQNMHVLPQYATENGPATQPLRNSAIHPGQTADDILSALLNLGVPVLHRSMPDGRAVEMVSKKPGDVVFILQSLPKNRSFLYLGQANREALHNHFATHLPEIANLPGQSSTSPERLDQGCRNILRTLPIFPLLHPGRRNAGSVSWGTAPQSSRFISQTVPIIPNISGTTFIDFEKSKPLCSALGGAELHEVAVLEMAITPRGWAHLMPDIVPDIIERLVNGLQHFSASTRKTISELDIVDVSASGKRKSPKSLIDPLSPLAELFDPEDEVIPVGKFAKGGEESYLQLLRNYSMLQAALTDEILEERLSHLVQASQGPSPDAAVKKALRLLYLLDEHGMEWFSYFSSRAIEVIRDKAWIPVKTKFYRPSDCWDSRDGDAFLCDWVLPRASVKISSPRLRACLGWDAIPYDVLRRQMLAVTDVRSQSQCAGTEDISERVRAILKTLASRLESAYYDRDELGKLADQLKDREWVPISGGRQIKAQHSWIPSGPSEKPLGSLFFPVSASLLKHDGMRALLTSMRLPERPSTAELSSSQQTISEKLTQSDLDPQIRDDLIRAAIEIALEIRRHRDDFGMRQVPLLVPSESGTLARAEDVLFNDMGVVLGGLPDGSQFAHPFISQQSARMLGLRQYRELQLIQLASVEDSGGISVGEDISSGIRSLIIARDIDHSINEWVASASHAGASVLRLLIDEAIVDGGRRCVPTKREMPTGPALVIHNNALLSDEDFQAFRNIGAVTQAKSSSLSPKHFTTVDVFDLVRGFYTAASQSLFFTPLHEISAQRRTPNLKLSPIWRVTASQKMVARDEVLNLFTAREIEIDQRDPEKQALRQRWLVTTSRVPRKAFPLEFERLVNIHWPSDTEFNFGMALNLSMKDYTSTSMLFSNSPLPVSVNLPVHIYAPWSITPDCRSISNGVSIGCDKPSPDSRYNRYMMQHFLPALYLQTLELLNKEYPKSVKLAWPRRSNADGEELVATELYRQFLTTPRLMLRSASDRQISPAAAVINFQRTPKAVQKILASLPIWNYVSDPQFDTNFLKEWGTLGDACAQQVSEALRAFVEEVHGLCRGDSPQIVLKDIEHILEYLLEAQESLVGIPLLPLGNGSISVFGSSQNFFVFASHFEFVEKFFGGHRTMSSKLTPALTKRISDPQSSLNIRQFTPGCLRQLLNELADPITPAECMTVGEDKFQWHRELLAFLFKEWQGDALRELVDMPLIPTENGDLLVSLEYAMGRKIWRKYSWEKPCLSSVFLQLQIPIVNFQIIAGIPLLGREVNEKHQLFDVLTVFEQASIAVSTITEQVNQEDWAEFAATLRHWIGISDLDSIFQNPELAGVLVDLPLFTGWQGSGSLPYVPPSNLVMLPVTEDMDLIAQFLPESKVFASRTPELESILSRYDPGRILSFQQVFGHVGAPGSEMEESLHPGLRAVMNLVLNGRKGLEASEQRPMPLGIMSQQSQGLHSEMVFTKWRNLRKNRESCDISFRPEGCVLEAHLVILAAVVPIFADVFSHRSQQGISFSRNSSDTEYPLPKGTSYFAVNGALDYVYNGNFVLPKPISNEDKALALDNLLDLLRLADNWKITELKDQVASRISDFELVNQNNRALEG